MRSTYSAYMGPGLQVFNGLSGEILFVQLSVDLRKLWHPEPITILSQDLPDATLDLLRVVRSSFIWGVIQIQGCWKGKRGEIKPADWGCFFWSFYSYNFFSHHNKSTWKKNVDRYSHALFFLWICLELIQNLTPGTIWVSHNIIFAMLRVVSLHAGSSQHHTWSISSEGRSPKTNAAEMTEVQGACVCWSYDVYYTLVISPRL